MRYKEITLQYKRPFTAGDLTAVEHFNAAFVKDDLHLKTHRKQLTVYLREIDLKRLKKTVAQLTARCNSALLADVMQSVENIKSYGISSGRRNYVEYNQERKVAQRQKKAQERMPFFYAQGHPFQTTQNTVPPEYTNAIITGDSEQVLQKLPDNCVDVVFTSPPYNFGLDYGDHHDAYHWQHYFDKLYAVFRQCIRVLKYGGRIIVNIQPLYSDYIPSHHLLSNFFINEKMIWKGEILWEKNNYNCKYTAWGSWKSPGSPYLKYTWEFIEIFCKGALKKSGDKDNIDISADNFKKWVTAKWSIAPERKMREYQHPAMFPEELAARVFQLFSYKNDLILDPFNGAGTATAVAKRLQRRYLGIDISPEYCKTAKQRLQEDTGAICAVK